MATFELAVDFLLYKDDANEFDLEKAGFRFLFLSETPLMSWG